MALCMSARAPAWGAAAASASNRRPALAPSAWHGSASALRAPARRALPNAIRPSRRGTVGVSAIQVSGPSGGNPFDETPEPGTFDPNASKPIIDGMVAKIKEALETEQVVVGDVYGDGRHVTIEVVSEMFEGKRSVARQQMVFKAIWEEMQEKVHAVDSMTTKTPEEAA